MATSPQKLAVPGTGFIETTRGVAAMDQGLGKTRNALHMQNQKTTSFQSLRNENNSSCRNDADKDHKHIKGFNCDSGGKTTAECATECQNTPNCRGFGVGKGAEGCDEQRGKCNLFSDR